MHAWQVPKMHPCTRVHMRGRCAGCQHGPPHGKAGTFCARASCGRRGLQGVGGVKPSHTALAAAARGTAVAHPAGRLRCDAMRCVLPMLLLLLLP